MPRTPALNSPQLVALTVFAFALGLPLPVATASLVRPAPASLPDWTPSLVLAVAFVILISAIVMPALTHVARLALRLVWPLAKIVAQIACDEIVKSILLAGAASLGLLQYLQALPAFH